jgi:DNA primase
MITPDRGYADLVAVHDLAARFYQDQLPGSWAQDYLLRRGVTDLVI